MALVYRTVKEPKLAVFASTFTLITRQPEVVQPPPLYRLKARRKSFLMIILPLRPAFALSALPAKIASIGLKTGQQHYNITLTRCITNYTKYLQLILLQ